MEKASKENDDLTVISLEELKQRENALQSKLTQISSALSSMQDQFASNDEAWNEAEEETKKAAAIIEQLSAFTKTVDMNCLVHEGDSVLTDFKQFLDSNSFVAISLKEQGVQVYEALDTTGTAAHQDSQSDTLTTDQSHSAEDRYHEVQAEIKEAYQAYTKLKSTFQSELRQVRDEISSRAQEQEKSAASEVIPDHEDHEEPPPVAEQLPTDVDVPAE
ncbi:hypothetical protein [Paenibacillus albus]|uniref:Uncharacterized protein n=1 Tax=Paenibacillus albus TaxID=2495582 RepID=A0A3Q8X3B4_9BACL|nr:hypothetical protein [Paenibacillus albus]AZN39493.1 hypothetical protein EJC50_07320 [Paenibacillus albus]